MNSDDLEQLLKDGWEIAGYSVNIMALGALSHHVLLRQGTNLTTITIVSNAGKELGRGSTILSPSSPPAKKGFFG